MIPLFGPELSRARAADLVAAARRGAGRGRRGAVPRPRWRASLGLRLVSAGFRLLGEGVQGR